MENKNLEHFQYENAFRGTDLCLDNTLEDMVANSHFCYDHVNEQATYLVNI